MGRRIGMNETSRTRRRQVGDRRFTRSRGWCSWVAMRNATSEFALPRCSAAMSFYPSTEKAHSLNKINGWLRFG